MAWRLSGLESLGKDFSVSQAEGVVGPCTEFGVHLYFKPVKALSIKKTIRLEVRGTAATLLKQGGVISSLLLGMETVLEGYPAERAKL